MNIPYTPVPVTGMQPPPRMQYQLDSNKNPRAINRQQLQSNGNFLPSNVNSSVPPIPHAQQLTDQLGGMSISGPYSQKLPLELNQQRPPVIQNGDKTSAGLNLQSGSAPNLSLPIRQPNVNSQTSPSPNQTFYQNPVNISSVRNYSPNRTSNEIQAPVSFQSSNRYPSLNQSTAPTMVTPSHKNVAPLVASQPAYGLAPVPGLPGAPPASGSHVPHFSGLHAAPPVPRLPGATPVLGLSGASPISGLHAAAPHISGLPGAPPVSGLNAAKISHSFPPVQSSMQSQIPDSTISPLHSASSYPSVGHIEPSQQQFMPQNIPGNAFNNVPPPISPGLPSLPGTVQRQQFLPQGPPAAGMQAPPQRPINAEMMPNPISVMNEDKRVRSGPFHTNTRGQIPPLATTDFTVFDEGICSPRFIRSTIYNVPCQPEMLKQSSLPFAITITPFAKVKEGEVPPPISDLAGFGPTRCNRCKAYMCPFMKFVDGGRRFQCAFCDGYTDVPQEYFAYLDNMGQRSDKFQRPELCLGSYEFIANTDYCKNEQFPNAPAFIFLIDVSYNSVKSGLVQLLCKNMKKLLKELPKEGDSDVSSIKVGFVTYSDVVHFYNIKGSLSQPQMLMVSDINDMFVPLVDGFLVLAHEAEGVIDSLMEQIPIMFGETKQTEVILGPAIQAGLEALKASDCAGKLYVFHSTLPNADAPGRLKNREDRTVLGTEKEKLVLNPQVPFYTKLGQDCVAAGCSVDLFLFPNAYIDISTIGEVCQLTGGQIYKYSYFQADIDGDRFLDDLRNDINQSLVFDATMRVRTSAGIRATDFYGNYYMSNTTDLEIATLDNTKSITAEIKYDDKLPEEGGAYIQVATLFTSCSGQRRIRISNLCLNTCSEMRDLFQSSCGDVVIHFFAKRALKLLVDQTLQQIKEGMVSVLVQMLAAYRKHCTLTSSTSQMILPETLKLLPLYVNCILKSDAVGGGSDLHVDDRRFAMLILNSMNLFGTIWYFYPRLISLHDIDVNSTMYPNLIRCSMANVKDNGAYLLENGIYMFMWIGQNIEGNWIQDVFGVPTLASMNVETSCLPVLNTLLSQRIHSVIDEIRIERCRYLKLFVIRQGDKLDIVFRQFLIEDHGIRGSPSYVEFLCQIQQEICKLSN